MGINTIYIESDVFFKMPILPHGLRRNTGTGSTYFYHVMLKKKVKYKNEKQIKIYFLF